MTTIDVARIRELNDAFRTNPTKRGKLMLTANIAQLPLVERVEIIERVRAFDDFPAENDPYHEHDFGAFTFNGHRIIWKIEYYDLNCEYGSDDPADPSKTTRVLTIMFAEDY